jgi:hypothetical protein
MYRQSPEAQDRTDNPATIIAPASSRTIAVLSSIGDKTQEASVGSECSAAARLVGVTGYPSPLSPLLSTEAR